MKSVIEKMFALAVEDLPIVTKDNDEMSKAEEKAHDELYKTLDDKQKELLDKFLDLSDENNFYFMRRLYKDTISACFAFMVEIFGDKIE